MVISNLSKDCDKQYFMGVDIGGTKIWTCITNSSGSIVYRKKIRTSNNTNNIKNIILTCLKEANISLHQLNFISFGIPGTTDSERGIILDAPALEWVDFSFKSEMESILSIPVFVNNDANCAALGERWLGAACNLQDFVFVAIGTGVGAAIVSNGSLIQGENFMAGEIAYFLLDGDIEQNQWNSKGQFGMFENKASGTALAKHGTDPEELFSLYKKGDPQSVRIINEFLNYLSIGLANVVSLLNPRKIILGGGVSQSLGDFIPLIERKVSSFTPLPCLIEQSKLGELAGAIGAIAFGKEQQVILEQKEMSENGKESIT